MSLLRQQSCIQLGSSKAAQLRPWWETLLLLLQDPGNVSPDTNHTFSLLSRLSLLPGDGSRSGGMKASRITDVLVALYL